MRALEGHGGGDGGTKKMHGQDQQNSCSVSSGITHQGSDPGRTSLPLSWLEIAGILLSFIGALAGLFFVVGRGYLAGWYDAAGVPMLTFSWPWHDVVLRGFTDGPTWLLTVFAAATASIYVPAIAILGGVLERGISRWRYLSRRGEGLLEHFRRSRLAAKARKATLDRAANAEELFDAWWKLRYRGAKWRRHRNRRQKLEWWVQPIVVGVISLGSLVAATALYGLFNILFWDHPYRKGGREFRELYEAVTSSSHLYRNPEATAAPSSGASTGAAMAPAPSTSAQALSRYSFVAVRRLDPDPNAQGSTCGLLLQEFGNRLLLLNRSGLHTLVFGDAPYSWHRVSAEACDLEMNRGPTSVAPAAPAASMASHPTSK